MSDRLESASREQLIELARDLGEHLATLPMEPAYWYGKPTRRGVILEALDAVAELIAGSSQP